MLVLVLVAAHCCWSHCTSAWHCVLETGTQSNTHPKSYTRDTHELSREKQKKSQKTQVLSNCDNSLGEKSENQTRLQPFTSLHFWNDNRWAQCQQTQAQISRGLLASKTSIHLKFVILQASFSSLAAVYMTQNTFWMQVPDLSHLPYRRINLRRKLSDKADSDSTPISTTLRRS